MSGRIDCVFELKYLGVRGTCQEYVSEWNFDPCRCDLIHCRKYAELRGSDSQQLTSGLSCIQNTNRFSRWNQSKYWRKTSLVHMNISILQLARPCLSQYCNKLVWGDVSSLGPSRAVVAVQREERQFAETRSYCEARSK